MFGGQLPPRPVTKIENTNHKSCTFRGRRSILCKFSWQVQGIVRLQGVVDVNVAVTLGLACERVLFGGAGIAKLLGSVA